MSARHLVIGAMIGVVSAGCNGPLLKPCGDSMRWVGARVPADGWGADDEVWPVTADGRLPLEILAVGDVRREVSGWLVEIALLHPDSGLRFEDDPRLLVSGEPEEMSCDRSTGEWRQSILLDLSELDPQPDSRFSVSLGAYGLDFNVPEDWGPGAVGFWIRHFSVEIDPSLDVGTLAD